MASRCLSTIQFAIGRLRHVLNNSYSTVIMFYLNTGIRPVSRLFASWNFEVLEPTGWLVAERMQAQSQKKERGTFYISLINFERFPPLSLKIVFFQCYITSSYYHLTQRVLFSEALFNLDSIKNLGVQQQDTSNKHRKRASVRPGLQSDMTAKKVSQQKNRDSSQSSVDSGYKPVKSANPPTGTSYKVGVQQTANKTSRKPVPSDSDIASSDTSKRSTGWLLLG